MPTISYFVGQPPVGIHPDSPQWRASLPMNRRERQPGRTAADTGPELSYGTYFKAAGEFLTADNAAVMRKAAFHLLGRPVTADQIETVSIHLVKHGAFYHPSKVCLEVDGRQASMALNVAVSDEGRGILETEYGCLKRLNQQFEKPYIPQVFGIGRAAHGSGVPVMFAAQWLNGFSEFHLSAKGHAGRLHWVVWDEEAGHRRLTRREVALVYRQATGILTTYYNPLTFDAVLNWHHGAGDFVVRPDGDHTDVRLITVRRYDPMIDSGGQKVSLQAVLDACLVFLVQTSLRMRIDRVDGVGELAMAPAWTLAPVWQGFAAAVGESLRAHRLPDEFRQGLLDYILIQSEDSLVELVMHVAGSYPRSAGEAALIRRHAVGHAAELAAVIRAG